MTTAAKTPTGETPPEARDRGDTAEVPRRRGRHLRTPETEERHLQTPGTEGRRLQTPGPGTGPLGAARSRPAGSARMLPSLSDLVITLDGTGRAVWVRTGRAV